MGKPLYPLQRLDETDRLRLAEVLHSKFFSKFSHAPGAWELCVEVVRCPLIKGGVWIGGHLVGIRLVRLLAGPLAKNSSHNIRRLAHGHALRVRLFARFFIR